MALNFERGIAALKASDKGGGNFRPFTPFLSWEDGEEKYVAFLNPVDEIPKVDIHEFIKVGEGKRADDSTFPLYEHFLDRRTPAIGEDEDPLSDKGSDSKERNIAVAVELEPIMGTGKGGKARPKGFEVKTVEFKRRVLDDEGEDTGEKEDVVAPVIGFVTQSPYNFFGYLGSHNESEGPHEDTAFRIKRRGKKTNTTYDWTPYLDQELDLSAVIENLDGISYLKDEIEDLEEGISKADDLETAVHMVATTMLEKRLEELADRERYDELTGDIEEIKNPWGKKKDKDDESKSTRKTQSARKTKKTDESEDAPESEPEADSSSEEGKKLEAFERLRAKSKRAK